MADVSVHLNPGDSVSQRVMTHGGRLRPSVVIYLGDDRVALHTSSLECLHSLAGAALEAARDLSIALLDGPSPDDIAEADALDAFNRETEDAA